MWLLSIQQKVSGPSDQYLLEAFYLVCGIAGAVAALVFGMKKSAERAARSPAAVEIFDAAEVATAVSDVAERILELRPMDLDRSLRQDLRIPGGHLHQFWDELESRWGLWLPDEQSEGIDTMNEALRRLHKCHSEAGA